MSNGTWIQTVSGKRVDLVNPDPDTIDILDIAHALSQICRYTGHCNKFYSVAEHSIRVAQIVPPELRLHALLHDTSEAYLQDISRPLKNLLPSYRLLETDILEVIYTKWLEYRDEIVIKGADNVLLVTEGRDLMNGTKDWGLTESPLFQVILPWSSAKARKQFLQIFNEETK
ncbi:MAG: hypothetical protein MUP81_00115 [Dehalococcoidia bacterium]|nr:hypothetical protein [Dehalococcoidia bacterium]